MKSVHDQARDQEKRARHGKTQDTEVLDEKIQAMIQKENDIIYNDDYTYFQFFGKKKLDEENWRALHREDALKYKKRKSKHLLVPERKDADVLLARSDDEQHAKDAAQELPKVLVKRKHKHDEHEEEEMGRSEKKVKQVSLVDYTDEE